MTMNFEDRGKYITILALMHQQGRMNEETIRFLVGSISDNLKVKFRIDENGMWYNEKLEDEIRKRAKFAESRRENGKKGGRKASAEPSGLPSAIHSGEPTDNLPLNINIDSIINTNSTKEGVIGGERKPPTLETIEYYFIQQGGTKKMALHFYNKHSATGWMANGQPIKSFTFLITNFINNWRDNEKLKRNSKDAWKLDGSPDIEYDPL